MLGSSAKQVAASASASAARPHLIILEGNIGVGKTTLAADIGRKLNYLVMFEPMITNPYLEAFYKEPHLYALKLQLWIYRQRFRTYVNALRHVLETGQGVILDRSVFSDSVFADVNAIDGNINEEGYSYYNELRRCSLENLPLPHFTIYLNASPAVCKQRIANRSRSCEEGVPLAYLESLDRAYSNFLDGMRKSGSNVLSFDWNTFGTSNEVCQLLQSIHAPAWTEQEMACVRNMISSEREVSRALNIPRFLQEAVEVLEAEAVHDNEEERTCHQIELQTASGETVAIRS